MCRKSHRRKLRRMILSVACIYCCWSPLSRAQLNFTGAVNLAVDRGSRMKAARIDVQKARAAVAIARDMYIPSVVTAAGVGDTYGITLTVPTIFTIGAQSLIYSQQQRSSQHAAHLDLEAAQSALEEARQQTEEDVAIAYLTLDQAQMAARVLALQNEEADRLVAIVEDRVRAGLDNSTEFAKAHRRQMEIQLQQLETEDNIETQRDYLAELTQTNPELLVIVPESIPGMAPSGPDDHFADIGEGEMQSPGTIAAAISAKAIQERAHGNSKYTWRPIVAFGAQYGRISPINEVSEFYNLHGNYNTANIGIQLQFPLVDRVRSAAARQAIADLQRAMLDASDAQLHLQQSHRALHRALEELGIKAKLAELSYRIARDDLGSARVRQHTLIGPVPETPKETEYARIDELQKYLDLLGAKIDLAKAQVQWMRSIGRLDQWIADSPAAASLSSGALSDPFAVQPAPWTDN